MERVVAATKKYLGLGDSKISFESFQKWGAWFPFLGEQRLRLTPDYTKRGDHLFIADKQSAKELMYSETTSFALITTILCIVLLVLLAAAFSTNVLVVVSGLVALFYFIFMVFKFFVIFKAMQYPLTDFTKEEIDALTDEELPVYTVFVPLREEAEVMEQIVAAMQSLDWPEEKMNLLITVEVYDKDTIEAIERVGIPESWGVVVLPDTQPKTKPKAMNCAFLEAKGEFSVIYDAEIIPDPDQLKKAYLAFKKYPEIAAFQTRLDHYNVDQNVLTKLFNTEFSFHYDMFLPGLQRFNFPIPLSGHSVHFRTHALKEVGAWDPYNVAEDCEIGMRMFRYGYRTGIINSLSREEAAADLMGWIKQRTRWMKGFIQTSVVHLRYPMALKRDLGSWRDFFAFMILVPGTVLLNLLNFVTVGILILWFATGAEFIQKMYPLGILYIANTAAIIGGFTFMYLNLVALYRRDRFHLVKYFFLTPFYWFLLALATARAVWQLRDAKSAHKWEKTTHGSHLSG